MQQMTKEAVKKLLGQTNHSLTVDDLDLIEKLDRVADEVCHVTHRERRLLNQPIPLCGVNFYPLTVAKSLWFSEKCRDWGVSDYNREGLLIWLLTVENTEAALDSFTRKKDADKASRKLSRRLHCTDAELTDVYVKCVGGTRDDGSTGKDVDYGGLVAALLREYGCTPEKWLYETPVEMIGVLFKAAEDKATAEQDAARATSAKGGKAVAPPPSARLAGLSRFRDVTNEILEAWTNG